MTSSLVARRRLDAIADRQAGYVTTRQALDAGYSHQAQWYHRERGHWVSVRRGIVRLAERPRSPHERFVVACLVAGADSVVCRFSALDVHAIRQVTLTTVHLWVPSGAWRRPDGLTLHAGEVPAPDRTDAGGFLVTTPVRTLRDVHAAERPEGPAWIRRAVRLGLVTTDEAAGISAAALTSRRAAPIAT